MNKIKCNINKKITDINEARKLLKNREKIIKKRKKMITIKRIILLSIIMISVLITLLLKLPYFNVNKITVNGNYNITSKQIIKLSNINTGNNIFYINSDICEKSILNNPYILSVNIKKKFPNNIIVNVVERKAVLYVLNDGYYYIIDKDSVVLEKKESINNMHLIKLLGTDNHEINIGQVLNFDNSEKVDIVKSLSNIIDSNVISKGINVVDISDIYNIKVYLGKLCLKLGDKNNISAKLNKAFSIIEQQKIKNKKGYVDVSYKGNPVFFIQK